MCYCTSSTNLESRDQWSAEPTAPSLLLFSESHIDSESRNESLFFFFFQIRNNYFSFWPVVFSLAEAVFQRQWGHLSSEPVPVFVGQLEVNEALDGSRRCTGSLPAVWESIFTGVLYEHDLTGLGQYIRTYRLREGDAINFNCRHLLHGV